MANGEKFLALAERIGGASKQYRPDDIYQVWRNCLLYDEHTWGAYCSISEPDSPFTKAAVEGQGPVRRRCRRGAPGALGPRDCCPGLARPYRRRRHWSFSIPTSWPRTDILRVNLPEGMGVADPDIPSCASPDGTLLLVKDVPACGYRVLKLAAAQSGRQPQPAEGTVIESRFYRVQFDPAGGITSIRDKELDRELVDPKAPYRLNQYVYVAGGKGTRIVMDPNGPSRN